MASIGHLGDCTEYCTCTYANGPPGAETPNHSTERICLRQAAHVKRGVPIMRLAAFLGIALLLVGCGTTTSTRLDLKPVEVTSFQLNDERPENQRRTQQSKISSGTMTNIGDDGVSPAPPEIVRTWLHEKFATRITGSTVVLREFSIQVVDPDAIIDEGQFSNAASSTPGANPLSIVLARLMVGGIESVRGEKKVDVRIEGLIDDRVFYVRSGGVFRGRVNEGDINTVIMQALESMERQLGELLEGVSNNP